jgi:hypothetical protein
MSFSFAPERFRLRLEPRARNADPDMEITSLGVERQDAKGPSVASAHFLRQGTTTFLDLSCPHRVQFRCFLSARYLVPIARELYQPRSGRHNDCLSPLVGIVNRALHQLVILQRLQMRSHCGVGVEAEICELAWRDTTTTGRKFVKNSPRRSAERRIRVVLISLYFQARFQQPQLLTIGLLFRQIQPKPKREVLAIL